MKIAIVGSRNITNKDAVFRVIDDFIYGDDIHKGGITILSGGAKGIDSLARQWATERGEDFVLFEPYHLVDNRAEYSPKHFFIRNKQIIKNADIVLAIWDGQSKGTDHAIKLANKYGKRLSTVVVSTKQGVPHSS